MNKWMTCTSCKAIVQLNATGICLGCQSGFSGQLDQDKYTHELESQNKELENAVQIPKTKGVLARKKAKNSKEMGKRNEKNKKK